LLLEAHDLDVAYGRIRAVSGASVALDDGEIVAVLGANGAGKSSLLGALLGVVRPRAGRIAFAGADITGWSTARRVRAGLVLVPEGRRILVSLSVHENLLMGAYCRRDATAIAREVDRIYGRFPNLAARRSMPASILSGGEQQMLAIGRALLAKPRVMMLDEPSLGLSPKLVGQLFALLAELNREGMALLLVEQNTHKALQIAHRAYVLELGRVVMAGEPKALLEDRALQEAYLGQSARRETGNTATRRAAAPGR
jgi:branched-chain amino acid transport system ATP-binding protein